MLLSVNIHEFGCKIINVFDYGVLHQTPVRVINNMIYRLNYLLINPKNPEFGNPSRFLGSQTN